MKNQASFRFDRFSSLKGADLVDYVEPYLATHVEAIPESVYEQLVAGLTYWDEFHLVYAMELGMRRKPCDFARRVVPFLSHHDASVCCAAYRLIKSLPSGREFDDLVPEIMAVPPAELFSTNPITGERIRIGTNEAFLRDLVEKASLEVGKSALISG